MSIDKGRITGTQLMFTVACFIQASTLLIHFIVPIAHQDSWMIILFGGILCLPLVLLFRSLMALFPGKNLIQILEAVYGKVLGKILGAYYLWFFLTLASVNLTDMGEFTKLTLMKEAPLPALSVMCVLVAAMAVVGGAKIVTRYSGMFLIVGTLILVATLLLMLNQMEVENFMPMLNQPLEKYVQGVHIVSTIPFGEVVVVLMLNPNIKLSRRQLTKHLLGGFAFGGLTVLIGAARDVAVLGNLLDMFAMPSLVTLRLFNMGMAFSRVEVLSAAALITLLFFKIVLLYYITVMAAAQLFNLTRFRPLVLSIGALMITYGLTLYPSPVVHGNSGRQVVPFMWTPLEIIIPILTLIVAKLRRLPKSAQPKEVA